MKFFIDNQPCEVLFFHGIEDDGVASTAVEITHYLLPHHGRVTGFAYCHPDDQFCRRTGRRLALSRALYRLNESGQRVRREGISKDFTDAFWLRYFEQAPGEKIQKKVKQIQLPDGRVVSMAEIVSALNWVECGA